MKLLKRENLMGIVNTFVIDSPTASNISYVYNIGSILGLILVIQIITGIFLAFHYCSDISMAFDSISHIHRDVNYGYILRYTHANGAAFFFIFVYAHIGKAIYYGSYRSPRVAAWNIGILLFICMMATAFIGQTPETGILVLNASLPSTSLNNKGPFG